MILAEELIVGELYSFCESYTMLGPWNVKIKGQFSDYCDYFFEPDDIVVYLGYKNWDNRLIEFQFLSKHGLVYSDTQTEYKKRLYKVLRKL